MRLSLILVMAAACWLSAAQAHSETSVLFIGNSFTYGHGSAVRFYRADSVTDLNSDGIGGVPALFKSFADQAGLNYDVFLETRGGAGLDYHLENKLGVIGGRAWDNVVMHGYSTLDPDSPRDPTKLIATSQEMASFLRERNPDVTVYLMATYSRADETYRPDRAWSGEPIEAMARDVRVAYDAAAAAADAAGVIPVGEAWNLAMQSGLADPNPYDGIEADKLNLWTYDHYHASAHGYYLEALVIFGALTLRDPRSLGENECSAYELGLSQDSTRALQQIAFEQLTTELDIEPAPLVVSRRVNPQRCIAIR